MKLTGRDGKLCLTGGEGCLQWVGLWRLRFHERLLFCTEAADNKQDAGLRPAGLMSESLKQQLLLSQKRSGLLLQHWTNSTMLRGATHKHTFSISYTHTGTQTLPGLDSHEPTHTCCVAAADSCWGVDTAATACLLQSWNMTTQTENHLFFQKVCLKSATPALRRTCSWCLRRRPRPQLTCTPLLGGGNATGVWTG